jgi:hypothetical protein
VIYFIKSPDGPIKIGTTVRLSQRLRQLATEHGQGLEVLAVTTGSARDERRLHSRFHHLRRVGEWFEPGDDLLAFIVSDGKPWDGSDESPTVALNIKGDPAWREWVEEGAAHCRTNVSALIDVALAKYLKAEGFTKKPPERLP